MTANDKLKDGATEAISPSLATGPRRFSLHVATGIFCFVFALLFYWDAVLRIDFKRTDFLDLNPYPDAVEYFAQANSILKEGAPTIRIGYDKLPSRYPPGCYPILMIPWLRFLPHNGVLAPFRTNQTIALLLLAGSFVLYFAIGRALAGGLATLLIATQPAFVTFSRSSMSDLSGGAERLIADLSVQGQTRHVESPQTDALRAMSVAVQPPPETPPRLTLTLQRNPATPALAIVAKMFAGTFRDSNTKIQNFSARSNKGF